MKYLALSIGLFFVVGSSYAGGNKGAAAAAGQDDVAIELDAMQAGAGGDRASDIRITFGELVTEHEKQLENSDLRKQLARLDQSDFQKLGQRMTTRSGTRGWFGGRDKSSELLFLMTELSHLRLDNERLAKENEELIRAKYDRCRVISWVVTTLCLGSTAASSVLGTQLSSALSDPGTAETLTAALNATTGT